MSADKCDHPFPFEQYCIHPDPSPWAYPGHLIAIFLVARLWFPSVPSYYPRKPCFQRGYIQSSRRDFSTVFRNWWIFSNLHIRSNNTLQLLGEGWRDKLTCVLLFPVALLQLPVLLLTFPLAYSPVCFAFAISISQLGQGPTVILLASLLLAILPNSVSAVNFTAMLLVLSIDLIRCRS